LFVRSRAWCPDARFELWLVAWIDLWRVVGWFHIHVGHAPHTLLNAPVLI